MDSNAHDLKQSIQDAKKVNSGIIDIEEKYDSTLKKTENNNFTYYFVLSLIAALITIIITK